MTNKEILVLQALYNKELSGLQVIESIADIKGQSLDIGSFYPVFQKLEEKGLIKSRWGTERSNDRAGAKKDTIDLPNQEKNPLLTFKNSIILLIGILLD
jgi:DNA-binding PadR family transcriptional regulator